MAREIVLRPHGKLTASWLERIRVEAGVLYEGRQMVAEGVLRVTVKDTDVPGLELRLTGTGARAWAVSKRVNGIQRRFTVPHGGRLSLAEARRAAIRLLDELAAGRDPTMEQRNARNQARAARLEMGVPGRSSSSSTSTGPRSRYRCANVLGRSAGRISGAPSGSCSRFLWRTSRTHTSGGCWMPQPPEGRG